MTEIEVTRPRQGLTGSLRLLATSGKRPGTVKELPAVRYVRPRVRIDEAHLSSYAALCGFTTAQGVPPTYPQLLSFPLMLEFIGSAFCPWPAMGTVHLANAIEQRSALCAGESVRVELETGRLLAHEKGQAFTLELRILREGQMVWRATQTLLRIGVRDAVGAPCAGALPTQPPLSCQADFIAPAGIGRDYGAISGDLNPIHLSRLTARLFGFRRAIAHGLWTKARALAILMPPGPVDRFAATVEFKTPLLLPAHPSLWAAGSAGDTLFEVRDSTGTKPHLRGHLAC